MNTHTPAREWKLRAYLRGESDHVDAAEMSRAIELVSDVRSKLITAQKHPTRTGARDRLVERLAHLHRLIAGLRREPMSIGLGPSYAPHTAGRTEREIPLAEGEKKSGQLDRVTS